MSSALPFWLELTFQQSVGAIGRTGQLTMAGRFSAHATTTGELVDGTVTVLVRDAGNTWQTFEQPVTAAAAQAVAAHVQALGMPGQAPRVEAQPDTSDLWTHVTLTVLHNDKSVSLNLPMQCSGFDGEDKAELQSLFRAMFAAAGFSAYDPIIFGNASD